MSNWKIILLILALLTGYVLSLNMPYLDYKEFQGEEGRRVNVAVHMVKTGDYIVPHHEGAVYLRKPPLFNWMLAGMFRLTGDVSELTARTVSVLSGLLCAFVVCLFWRKVSDAQGMLILLPGLVFLTFPDVMDKSIRAEIDMTFTLVVTLSILSWYYFYQVARRPALSWIAGLGLAGLGFLTKGVQAVLFFYTAVIPYLIYKRNFRRLFSMQHVIGILAGTGVVLLWFIPLVDSTGAERVISVWVGEIMVRKEPIRAGGFIRHVAEFPLMYVKAYLPWIPFLILWRDREIREKAVQCKDIAVFSAFLLLFSFPLYWFLPGARLRYLLPGAAFLSILVSIPLFVCIREEKDAPRWAGLYLRGLGCLIMLAAVLYPLWGRKFGQTGRVVPYLFLLSAFVTSMILVSRRYVFVKKIAALFLVLLFLKVAWASIYFPYHREKKSYYRTAAAEINRIVPGKGMIYDYGVDNDHLAFYLRRPVKLIRSLHGIINGSYIYMKKESAAGVQLPGLAKQGEVRARKLLLYLYRAERDIP